VQALFDYGDALGIAFQIADDLLDYQGDSKATARTSATISANAS
jgi:octaprenyl-diphosphate synthase